MVHHVPRLRSILRDDRSVQEWCARWSIHLDQKKLEIQEGGVQSNLGLTWSQWGSNVKVQECKQKLSPRFIEFKKKLHSKKIVGWLDLKS